MLTNYEAFILLTTEEFGGGREGVVARARKARVSWVGGGVWCKRARCVLTYFD